eukprot:2247128-Pleurochrysis_carterae.AAC.3
MEAALSVRRRAAISGMIQIDILRAGVPGGARRRAAVRRTSSLAWWSSRECAASTSGIPI